MSYIHQIILRTYTMFPYEYIDYNKAIPLTESKLRLSKTTEHDRKVLKVYLFILRTRTDRSNNYNTHFPLGHPVITTSVWLPYRSVTVNRTPRVPLSTQWWQRDAVSSPPRTVYDIVVVAVSHSLFVLSCCFCCTRLYGHSYRFSTYF